MSSKDLEICFNTNDNPDNKLAEDPHVTWTHNKVISKPVGQLSLTGESMGT